MHPSISEKALRYLREQIGGFLPEILLILGSGLGFLGDMVEEPILVPYADVPGFPVSTAPGHRGRFIFGELSHHRVMVMQGRIHYYEGCSMDLLALPVILASALSAHTMIVTNAAGAVNPALAPGDIMLISDHIKLFNESPLRGPNPPGHPRFPDMTSAYDPSLRALAKKAAAAQDIPLREGVYMFFPGPQYETPAEIRLARTLGADAVGMSTVPEVISARHLSLDVLGFSLITNMGAGILDKPLTEEEVLSMGEQRKPVFSSLILQCLEMLPPG